MRVHDALHHAEADAGAPYLRVDGPTLAISPVTPASGPVVLGQELRDLGAAVGVIVIRALGGSVVIQGETLAVKLPE